MEYPKIQTLFKRDAFNLIIPSEFTKPEFEWLAKSNLKFEATEKIDGTNIRIEIFPMEKRDGVGIDWCVEYKGRTKNSEIPIHLYKKLETIFNNVDWNKVFDIEKCVNVPITIYGEGYGRKVQSGGGRYLSNDTSFILFDVKIGDYWMSREFCEEVAKNIGIKIVPVIGEMTINEAIEYVRKGFISNISEDRTLVAEGLVMRTPGNLRFNDCERIIFKIKTCDFRKHAAKYGENYTGPQTPNKFLDL